VREEVIHRTSVFLSLVKFLRYILHVVLPEHYLLCAVLERAALDAIGINGCESNRRHRARIRSEACAWFSSPTFEPGSFRWVCQMLDVDPGAVRHAISTRRSLLIPPKSRRSASNKMPRWLRF
jgi:hypothetical protein